MSQKIRDALQRLSVSDNDRLLSARLWDVIADIDAAIAAGVKEASIKKMLLEQGLELPPNSLRGVLYRYRKKRKVAGLVLDKTVVAQEKLKAAERPTVSSTRANIGAYKSDLTADERRILASMDPSEKIEFFRKRHTQNKFTHNPTPERFRKDGD